MPLFDLLLLAVGLSADAMAVSMSLGLKAKPLRRREALAIGGAFGGFQALMPTIGFYAGAQVVQLIQAWDHWLALGILTLVGGKAIWEGLHHDGEVKDDVKIGLRLLFALAVATSIDALAVGFTLPSLGAALASSVATIGVVTFSLSVVSVYIGRRFGDRFGPKVDIVGGLVLIGIGIRIVLNDLGGA